MLYESELQARLQPSLLCPSTSDPAGVMVRVLQRILALTAAIWHNDHTGAPVHGSCCCHGS